MASRSNALAVTGALVKVIIFACVGLLILGVLYVQFGQIRFNHTATYSALFTSASGMQPASNVTANGVPVGRVDAVDITPDDQAKVTFTIDSTVRLTSDVKALIRYRNLTGDQYLDLVRPRDSTDRTVVPPGATLPVSATRPSLDLDALLGGFNPLFQGLRPDQVNQLTGEIVTVLQGEGGTIDSVFQHAASLSGSLADQDKVIGDVITNLNTVLGSVDAHSAQLSATVDEASRLVGKLSRDRTRIVDGMRRTSDLANRVGDVADALRSGHETFRQLGRTAALFETPEFERVLTLLPGAYGRIGRVSTTSATYNIFVCSVQVRLTGPDGQPFTTPWIGPSPSLKRCNSDPSIQPLPVMKPQGSG
jgi:phospholipid/cholesterol/gamma-HCH transport system substrate-binding protein